MADILTHPADDAPRLILADWLEDNGDPLRAELIRTMLELWCRRDVDDGDRASRPPAYTAMVQRLKELIAGRGLDWGQEVAAAFGMPFPFDCTFRGGISLHEGPISWEWHRGFVRAVRLRLADFTESRAQAMFSSQPITEVRLTDRAPTPAEPGWVCWLIARDVPISDMGSHWIPEDLQVRGEGGKYLRHYPTAEEAHAALSAACVAYGRSLAGLPALPL